MICRGMRRRATSRSRCARSIASTIGIGVALGGLSIGLTLAAIPSPALAGEVPRFVSLRADKINVRAGPGVQYPIAWVFVRRGLPVEVVAEFELWRKVRDRDGAEGWVHRSLLSGKRSVVVRSKTIGVLFQDPDSNSVPVARVEPGVVADIVKCVEGWCRVEAAGIRGWMERSQLWGVYPAPDDGS